MKYILLILCALIVSCGKPGPTAYPFTCDMGNTEVRFYPRKNLSDYEIIAQNDGLGTQDVVYRGHESYLADFLNYTLPNICVILGGEVLEEEGQDLHDL